ncbi:MAG: gp58-like family protein [Candidatus Kryptonium sp.]|nr:gp58-like family protein [Candidatus Kryptonium sp.]
MPKVDVKKIIQELIVPELQEIKSSVNELKTKFDSEIKRLDEKIDLVKNELKSEINGLKVELKRLAALESKVASLIK